MQPILIEGQSLGKTEETLCWGPMGFRVLENPNSGVAHWASRVSAGGSQVVNQVKRRHCEGWRDPQGA